jgi:hypothetical protein
MLPKWDTKLKGVTYQIDLRMKLTLWKIILDEKINQTDRDVCCLDKKERGMDMINIEDFIRSKEITIIYKIIHSDLEFWNSIGKYWLEKNDNRFGPDYCRCQ